MRFRPKYRKIAFLCGTDRQYLPSGADLHSGDVRPRRDLPRNGPYLGEAGGGCAVTPAGRRAVFSHFEQSTKWRRVAATGIEAVLVHQRFMGSAFDPIAVAHHDEHAGGTGGARSRRMSLVSGRFRSTVKFV